MWNYAQTCHECRHPTRRIFNASNCCPCRRLAQHTISSACRAPLLHLCRPLGAWALRKLFRLLIEVSSQLRILVRLQELKRHMQSTPADFQKGSRNRRRRRRRGLRLKILQQFDGLSFDLFYSCAAESRLSLHYSCAAESRIGSRTMILSGVGIIR